MNRTFSIAFWTLCPGILLGLIAACCALGTPQKMKKGVGAESRPALVAGKKNPPPRKQAPVSSSSTIRRVSAVRTAAGTVAGAEHVPQVMTSERPVYFQLAQEQSLRPVESATDVKLQQLQTQLQQLLNQKNDQSQQHSEQLRVLMQQLQQQQLSQMEMRLESIQSAVKQGNAGQPVVERGTGMGNGSVAPLMTRAGRQSEPFPQEQAPAPESVVPEDPIPESIAAPRNELLPRPDIRREEPAADGEERFSLQVRDTEVAQVLDMLGEIAGANLIPSPNVQGKVTVNLSRVTLNQALQAILRSTGLVVEREGDLYYINTPEELIARSQEQRRLVTKVYRPQYISVQDLQSLLLPMLSQPLGRIAVTVSPDGAMGMGGMAGAGGAGGPQMSSQSSQSFGGGGGGNGTSGSGSLSGGIPQRGSNRLAQQDALLVRDFPEVIAEFDQVVAEMDIPPQQVHIEAMILSVKLDDQMALGVNFALLNGKDNQLVVSGNGAQLATSSGLPGQSGATIVPQNPFSDFVADAAGLKYGFIRGDVSAFISALENLTDTNLIATPQLMVLNKQRAQLIIGDRLSYSTSTFQNNQSIQNVNFVDAGTKLSLQPFVAKDGLVRMEIHPERSSAVINRITGLPDIATTEVTSNVMVRDGTTIVIGGLIEEQVTESQERIPLLGSLPVVGVAFRNKNEQTERRELIILITPRIVREEQAVAEADAAKYENERRAQHFQDKLAPANRRNLTRNHYNKALLHYERGELERARQHIKEAARQNKHDRQVLRLQERIEASIREQRKGWLPWSGGAESADEPIPEGDEELLPLPQESLPQESLPEQPLPEQPLPEHPETVHSSEQGGKFFWQQKQGALTGN